MTKLSNPYSKNSKRKRQKEFWEKYNSGSQEYRDSIDSSVNCMWFFVFIIVVIVAFIKIALTGESIKP